MDLQRCEKLMVMSRRQVPAWSAPARAGKWCASRRRRGDNIEHVAPWPPDQPRGLPGHGFSAPLFTDVPAGTATTSTPASSSSPPTTQKNKRRSARIRPIVVWAHRYHLRAGEKGARSTLPSLALQLPRHLGEHGLVKRTTSSIRSLSIMSTICGASASSASGAAAR